MVLLARYPCPYSRDEHDPALPPEDVDFSGRRRSHTPERTIHREVELRPLPVWLEPRCWLIHPEGACDRA